MANMLSVNGPNADLLDPGCAGGCRLINYSSLPYALLIAFFCTAEQFSDGQICPVPLLIAPFATPLQAAVALLVFRNL